MMKRHDNSMSKMQVFAHYGIGIPQFVPVMKRDAVEKCCLAIVKMFIKKPSLLDSYLPTQRGENTWVDIVVYAVAEGILNRRDADICISIAEKYNNMPYKYQWQKFTEGLDYEKEFYDVKTSEGEIIKNCWPNADFMNETTGEKQRHFCYKDNVNIRKSFFTPFDDTPKEVFVIKADPELPKFEELLRPFEDKETKPEHNFFNNGGASHKQKIKRKIANKSRKRNRK